MFCNWTLYVDIRRVVKLQLYVGEDLYSTAAPANCSGVEMLLWRQQAENQETAMRFVMLTQQQTQQCCEHAA